MTPFAVMLVLLTASGITVSSLLAFWWAGKSGQFASTEQGARQIFDADEIVSGTIRPEGSSHDATFQSDE